MRLKFSTNIYKVIYTWIPKASLPPLLKLLLKPLLFLIILLRTITQEITKKFYPQIFLKSNLLKWDKFCINCL